MQGGLAPLSISIVLAAAPGQTDSCCLPFRAHSRPVGVGEGPIARSTRFTGEHVHGEEGVREGGREGPTAAVPGLVGQGVAGGLGEGTSQLPWSTVQVPRRRIR